MAGRKKVQVSFVIREEGERCHRAGVNSLQYDPYLSRLYTAGRDSIIRIWNVRNVQEPYVQSMEHHTDWVNDIQLCCGGKNLISASSDTTQCLSGSSDGTIKLWSLGQQRCIATIYCHSEGVWALQTDEAFSRVYSSGRDRNVWATDLRQVERRALVCRETSPVLRMILTPDQKGLWTSTTESSVKWWNLNGLDYHSTAAAASYHDPKSMPEVKPEIKKPEFVISGGPSIKQCEILNDKRHILTKDTENNVSLYDVLKARKVEDLGQVEFEQEVKKRLQMVCVPSWFTVDLKTGMLTIHLGQGENDCLSAWVSARETGLAPNDAVDQKVNYGGLLLQALLEHWPRHYAVEEESDLDGGAQMHNGNVVKQGGGNEYFSVPGHTPVIFSEVGGRTLYRLLARDAGGETEGVLLNETVPSWVIDIVVEKKLPKFIKVTFFVLPHPSLGYKSFKRERLIANDFLQIRKVIEHVYEKVMCGGSDTGSNAGSPTGDQNNGGSNPGGHNSSRNTANSEDSASVAEERVELLCNDQVLDPNLDLRTVKEFIWKVKNNDLVLHYRPLR